MLHDELSLRRPVLAMSCHEMWHSRPVMRCGATKYAIARAATGCGGVDLGVEVEEPPQAKEGSTPRGPLPHLQRNFDRLPIALEEVEDCNTDNRAPCVNAFVDRREPISRNDPLRSANIISRKSPSSSNQTFILAIPGVLL